MQSGTYSNVWNPIWNLSYTDSSTYSVSYDPKTGWSEWRQISVPKEDWATDEIDNFLAEFETNGGDNR